MIAAGEEADRTAPSPSCHQRRTLLNLSAFAITDTELKVIAALAIMGLRSRPENGYRIPAAIGTPSEL
jgi:hypothetical protein